MVFLPLDLSPVHEMQSYRYAKASMFGLAALIVVGAAAEVHAQEPQDRIGGRKQGLDQLRAMPAADRVIVKFREGQSIRRSGERLTGTQGQTKALDGVLIGAGVSPAAIKPLIDTPPEQLQNQRSTAQRRSGKQLADLSLYFVIDLPPGVSAADVANQLNGLDFVEFARPALKAGPRPVIDMPPPLDPARTRQPDESPNLVSRQAYKGNAPRGINLPASVAGIDGAGVAFADMEGSWQLDHEDLKALGIQSIGPLIADVYDPNGNHGTAVLGIISGTDNAFGVTGIAPGAIARVVGDTTAEGYDPANAIMRAANELKPGDVLILEAQAPVCGSTTYEEYLGPIEYYQEIFDAVSTATSLGIIVLAAAGNGWANQGPGFNLDDPACQGAFDRTKRDSLAIIVGAGTSASRKRMGFSDYGSRVDVQGWGVSVASTGYGDAYNPSDDPRRFYTYSFGGTSSATPIVAGAVLAIQGVRKACGLPPATPVEMRDLLVRTGTPQGTPADEHIGPLPNVQAALEASVPAECLAAQQQTAQP
jgi:hypothetical protein